MKNVERVREIEKSIIKEYQLIKENDKIAVCISGGKDSMLLAKCLEELKRHGQFKFDLEYIVMDPGYSEETINRIKENLDILKIDATIFKSNIFEASTTMDSENPCYMCARMRRGALYNKAKELGCMLNLLFNGLFSSMMPKVHSEHFEGMELIRPLYLVREDDIISWSKYNNLTFIGCACSVTKRQSGKRKVIKDLIVKLKEIYPQADLNILKSSSNINLNTVLSYHKGGIEYSFLDDYDK